MRISRQKDKSMSYSMPPEPVLKGALFVQLQDHPGYAVSTDGRIWTCRVRGCRNQYRVFWKEIAAKNRITGYLQVGLNGITRAVHRLILETFIGPCPEGMECSHIDNNKGNNRLENLCWETPAQNNKRKAEHGSRQNGENSTNAKLTWVQVREIRFLRKEGLAMKAIARKYGVSESAIDHIIHHRNWKE
jgi:hypothetical protein